MDGHQTTNTCTVGKSHLNCFNQLKPEEIALLENNSVEVVYDKGETICQGEGQLGNRIRSGFRDVISGDRYRVEIPHSPVGEKTLNVAHQTQREFR